MRARSDMNKDRERRHAGRERETIDAREKQRRWRLSCLLPPLGHTLPWPCVVIRAISNK